MTKEEKKLLELLESGQLDGQVGDDFYPEGYLSKVHRKYIENGIPTMVTITEGVKVFDGKENYRGEKTIDKTEFTSDSDKLYFLQKYGWLMYNDEVQAYSAKYK